MKIILCIIFILMTCLHGAFERVPQSPLATGSAFSYFLPGNGFIDFLSHPAELAHVPRAGFSVFHSSPFRLAPLDQYGFTAAAPFKGGVVGTGFVTLGQARYRETVVTAGMGRPLGPHLETGILLSFLELYIAGYHTDRTVAVAASVTYALAKGIRWSLLYRNLNAPRVGRSRELLPQIISTGITVLPAETVTSVLELEKDLDYENRYKFGLTWEPLSSLTVASGFATSPAQFTAGIAVRFLRLSSPYEAHVSYGIATHPELPVSQVVSLQLALR